jgi:hypothetical protein
MINYRGGDDFSLNALAMFQTLSVRKEPIFILMSIVRLVRQPVERHVILQGLIAILDECKVMIMECVLCDRCAASGTKGWHACVSCHYPICPVCIEAADVPEGVRVLCDECSSEEDAKDSAAPSCSDA